jgi:hypothetical protein
MLTKCYFLPNLKKPVQVRILKFYTVSVSSTSNSSPWGTPLLLDPFPPHRWTYIIVIFRDDDDDKRRAKYHPPHHIFYLRSWMKKNGLALTYY